MTAKVEAPTQPPAAKVETPTQTKAAPPGTGGTPSSVASGQTTPAASQGTFSKIIAKIVALFEKIPGLGKLIFEPLFKLIKLHPTEIATVEAAAAKVEGTVIKDAGTAVEAAAGAAINGAITAAIPGPVGTEVAGVTVSTLDQAIAFIDSSLTTLAPEATDKLIELMVKIMEKTAGTSTASTTSASTSAATTAADAADKKKPISHNPKIVESFEAAVKSLLKHHPHLSHHHKADAKKEKERV